MAPRAALRKLGASRTGGRAGGASPLVRGGTVTARAAPRLALLLALAATLAARDVTGGTLTQVVFTRQTTALAFNVQQVEYSYFFHLLLPQLTKAFKFKQNLGINFKCFRNFTTLYERYTKIYNISLLIFVHYLLVLFLFCTLAFSTFNSIVCSNKVSP